MDDLNAKVQRLEKRMRRLQAATVLLTFAAIVLGWMVTEARGRDLPQELSVAKLRAGLVEASVVLVSEDNGLRQTNLTFRGLNVSDTFSGGHVFVGPGEDGQPAINADWPSTEEAAGASLRVGSGTDSEPRATLMDRDGHAIPWNGE